MKKIVFFDIDGTIWDWNRNIPDSCARAIRELRANGHLAYLCSGRSKGNIKDKRLLNIGFDGMVAGCGAYVEIGNEVIYDYIISKEETKRIVKLYEECSLPLFLEGPEKLWISDWGFENDDFVDGVIKTIGDSAVLCHSYMEEMRVNKFSSDILPGSDYDSFKKELIKDFDFVDHITAPGKLGMKESTEDDPHRICGLFEAVPKGITKGMGIARVLKELGIGKEDALMFGDSANDLDSFHAVGHPVAMGNAIDELKAQAEYVTNDVMNDGIANALKYYGLI